MGAVVRPANPGGRSECCTPQQQCLATTSSSAYGISREHTAMSKMKEEVDILKQIKEHMSPTSIYKNIKMFINIYTKFFSRVDRFSLRSIRVSGMWGEPEGPRSPLLILY